MESSNLLSTDLQVDIIAAAHLKETSGWARFLAVLGMLLSILIALAGMFAGTILSSMSRGFGNNADVFSEVGSITVTLFYVVIAAVYFMLSLFLFRFATKMRQALLASDQESFNGSLLNLKLVYRTMGIIAIIYLSFLALAMIVAIGAAAFMK